MNGAENQAARRMMEEFARLAPRYDRRWADYLRVTHERTLRRLELRPHHCLLDVGCGTGSLLQMIAARYPEVGLTGVDACHEMLEMARRKLGDRVALFRGQAERLPFADEEFDGVISCSSLHYWHQPLNGLHELARVLKPQGQMVITDWCGDDVAMRAVEFLLRVIRHETIHVLGCDACNRLLRTAGCQSIHTERYKVGWLWGLMTASARVQKVARSQITSAQPQRQMTVSFWQEVAKGARNHPAY